MKESGTAWFFLHRLVSGVGMSDDKRGRLIGKNAINELLKKKDKTKTDAFERLRHTQNKLHYTTTSSFTITYTPYTHTPIVIFYTGVHFYSLIIIPSLEEELAVGCSTSWRFIFVLDFFLFVLFLVEKNSCGFGWSFFWEKDGETRTFWWNVFGHFHGASIFFSTSGCFSYLFLFLLLFVLLSIYGILYSPFILRAARWMDGLLGGVYALLHNMRPVDPFGR